MGISRAAETFFAAFLRLYPSDFQAEFGLEVREVFSESMQQAERQGILAALGVGFREIVDLPVNLITEHWEEFQMQQLQLSQPVVRPVWWGAIGFGCAAALANLITTGGYLWPSAIPATLAPYWIFWGECILYAILGGLGGLVFALTCQQSEKAKLFFLAGLGGFAIGHLLWYPVMIGSGILIGFFLMQNESAVLILGVLTRLTDLVLVVSLTGLVIGWMNKNRPLAVRLAGNGAMGAGIGGLLGLVFCGVLLLIGTAAIGRIPLLTSLEFIVNCIGGIFGGALLGRAIGREKNTRVVPVPS